MNLGEVAPADIAEHRTQIRGHVILCRTHSRLAVWHVTADGTRTGAWVLDDPAASGDAAAAVRVLALVERRAVAGFEAKKAARYVERLAGVAGVVLPSPYVTCAVELRTFGQSINAERRNLAQALATRQLAAPNRKLGPLEYTYRVPDAVSTDVPIALQQLGLACVVADHTEPAVSMALMQATALYGWTRAWAETETARLRRRQLATVQYGGPNPRPLPDAWLQQLAIVYQARISIPETQR